MKQEKKEVWNAKLCASSLRSVLCCAEAVDPDPWLMRITIGRGRASRFSSWALARAGWGPCTARPGPGTRRAIITSRTIEGEGAAISNGHLLERASLRGR